MANFIHIVGRLTNDPVLKYGRQGTTFTRFTVAVKRGKKNEAVDSTGEEKADADYIPCIAFLKIAETVTKFLHKGSKVFVSGRMQSELVKNDVGESHNILTLNVKYIEFLDSYGERRNVGFDDRTVKENGEDEVPW